MQFKKLAALGASLHLYIIIFLKVHTTSTTSGKLALMVATDQGQGVITGSLVPVPLGNIYKFYGKPAIRHLVQ